MVECFCSHNMAQCHLSFFKLKSPSQLILLFLLPITFAKRSSISTYTSLSHRHSCIEILLKTPGPTWRSLHVWGCIMCHECFLVQMRVTNQIIILMALKFSRVSDWALSDDTFNGFSDKGGMQFNVESSKVHPTKRFLFLHCHVIKICKRFFSKWSPFLYTGRRPSEFSISDGPGPSIFCLLPDIRPHWIPDWSPPRCESTCRG